MCTRSKIQVYKKKRKENSKNEHIVDNLETICGFQALTMQVRSIKKINDL